MVVAADLDDRITKCEKLLDANPNSQIFAALAEAFRRKGQLEKAFQICQNGLRIHPSYGSAHVVMAKINLDRGLYDWAEIEAKKAREIDGSTTSIQLLLAEIYIYKGDVESAIRLLKKLSEADPNNAQIRKLLDIAHRITDQTRVTADSEVADDPTSGRKSDWSGEEADDQEPVWLNEREVLKRSRAVPGVVGALFVNNEGLLVDSQWSAGFDASVCAASLSDVGTVVNEELVETSFGKVKTLLVETRGPVFYLVRVAGGAFLFATNGSAGLGTLRMKVDELLQKYQATQGETVWK